MEIILRKISVVFHDKISHLLLITKLLLWYITHVYAFNKTVVIIFVETRTPKWGEDIGIQQYVLGGQLSSWLAREQANFLWTKVNSYNNICYI